MFIYTKNNEKEMNDYPFGARYIIFVVCLNLFANLSLYVYPTPS